MLEHVLRTQVVYRQDGSLLTSINRFTPVGSGGAENARLSSHLGHITVRPARDAFQRWITIVPGPSTAFHIVPFLISSASSSTLLFQ